MKHSWPVALFVVSLAWVGCTESSNVCLNVDQCAPRQCHTVYCDDRCRYRPNPSGSCTVDGQTGKCTNLGECEVGTGGTGGSAGSGGTGGSGGVLGCGDLIDSFGDGDFGVDDWGWEVVAERSINFQVPEVTDPMLGGNPAAYRNVEMTTTASAEQGGAIWVAHNLSAAEHTPANEGEICGIRMFLDGTDQFNLLESHQAIFSVFLLQNDTYYWGERLFVNGEMWTTGEWPIDDPENPGTPFGFQKFAGDGPDAPDLATGSVIQFGFLTGASRPVTAPGSGTNYSGADNFRVELYAPLSE